MQQDSKPVMSNTVDKPKRWSQKTDQEKYLEWVNDWLTVSACAENYGLTDKELLEILERGKSANEMAAYVALKKENEELKERNRVLVEALEGLPFFLNNAADSLEFQANKIGNTNVLTPKLKWYADKIKALQSNQ